MRLLVELMGDTGVTVVYEPERPGEIRRAFSDITRARQDLGYAPDTALADGMKVTADWFRQEYGG